MTYMVLSPSGFKTYFNKGNIPDYFANPLDIAKRCAKRSGGKVFYKNPSPYKFIKDGKVCRGSEDWLPL